MNTLLSIQILPQDKNRSISISLIEEAIGIIEASGLRYRVGALETTVEGDWEDLLNLITAMNQRVLELGASQTMFQIKILHKPEGITISALTHKYDDET
ncbi:thiamine-binding protein [Shimazuella sp. AN120528]|uniref:thiamine-binding protein n=1 Tax=Shimazuella soli TaxID=1892854 RepID=UPI001F0F0991|nr:thiamine-binding protein [Shimazuella soli]MCH5584165.1 thiamine-binding protein [Shimazuella soli]